jgi:hypothetical protein
LGAFGKISPHSDSDFGFVTFLNYFKMYLNLSPFIATSLFVMLIYDVTSEN